MKERLKPVKVKSVSKIYDITGIAIKDHLGSINRKGEFTLINIAENGRVKIEDILINFPSVDGWEVKSDNEYNFIWMIRGWDFYVIDIETKKIGHCIVSSDTNDNKIVNSQLIDPENKIFMIELSRLGPGLSGLAGFIYVLYDLNQDKIIYESPLYSGDIFRFNKNALFFGKLKSEEGKILYWNMRDFKLNKLNDKTYDKLIKKINTVYVELCSLSKPLSYNNRVMIGTGKVNKETVYYTIRWDEDFEDIKIEPIILQRPNGNFMDGAFEFSGDGKWVKTLRFPFNNGREMPPELMIYHVSDIYPQGLSMPILCGFTMPNTPGAFMDHSEWGMCYVQRIDSNTLYVYKLNDGLKLLAKEAVDVVK